MAAVCEVCGKHPSFGMNVSHSHRRTKRRWNPNIQRVRAMVNGTPRGVNVCTVLPAGREDHQARPRRTRRQPPRAVAAGHSAAVGRALTVGQLMRRVLPADCGQRLATRSARRRRRHRRRPAPGRAGPGPRRPHERIEIGRGHDELVVLPPPRASSIVAPAAPGTWSRRNPTPDVSARWKRSAAKPSDTSIMADAPASRAASPAASSARGRRKAAAPGVVGGPPTPRARPRARRPAADAPRGPVDDERVARDVPPSCRHRAGGLGHAPVTVTATTSTGALDRSPPTTGTPVGSRRGGDPGVQGVEVGAGRPGHRHHGVPDAAPPWPRCRSRPRPVPATRSRRGR